ncbi:MAG: PAS domain S-box protein [Rhodospirillaceae bacterium]|jgi:PAS domain S-box-containing protein|nr:PAS domain S-box protein [Rhodospirillaceae bacterium]MBT5561173.1 PAS domain S-box protein [Rhodospirillaceae bacterium]MBT6242867.1 PAS domain S-box protein [Rhodospirillaceae bacterium]MBT7136324.1 PAS domain S-box protein [Rhodospirillaceae bacterium]
MSNVENSTSSKKLESKLYKEEKRLLRAEQFARLGHWQFSIVEKNLISSDEMNRIYGYDPKVHRMTLDEGVSACHTEDLERVQNSFDLAIETGQAFEYEHRIVRTDGKVRTIHAKAECEFGNDGSVVSMFGIIQDITERKQAEYELERIFDLSPDMIGSGNLEGYFTKINSSFERTLGYGNDEFCTKSFLEYVHEEDIEKTTKALTDAANGTATDRFVVTNRYRKKNGSYIWIEWHVQAYVKENSFYAVGWDITEGKQAADDLRKLSRAVEQSSNAVFITDTDGTIEYINSKFTALTGYKREEVIGQNPRILKSGDTPENVYVEFWDTIKNNGEWKGEMKDRHKNGELFWVYETVSPVMNDNNKITHYVATHEDISERKAAELATQNALEQAEEANRAKSDLMANMSHELRTPLNAIIGFSRTIKEEIFGPLNNDKYQEYLNDIHNSGQHLLGLIDDILDASAIEARALELQEESVNIVAIIESTIRLIELRAKEGLVTIKFSFDPEIPLIYVDSRRTTQIMLNLLSNAIKFTPEGGEVSVHLRLNDDGSVAISVSDTGAGMNDREMEIALSRFGQVDSGLDRMHEGTGLGLPLTKGLMELHGGTLEIESEKGKGTLITATFPKERVVQNIR